MESIIENHSRPECTATGTIYEAPRRAGPDPRPSHAAPSGAEDAFREGMAISMAVLADLKKAMPSRALVAAASRISHATARCAPSVERSLAIEENYE